MYFNVRNQNAWFDIVESGLRLSCECCCRSCGAGPPSQSPAQPGGPGACPVLQPQRSCSRSTCTAQHCTPRLATPGKKIKAGLCANLHPRALMSTSHPASAAGSDPNLEAPLRSSCQPVFPSACCSSSSPCQLLLRYATLQSRYGKGLHCRCPIPSSLVVQLPSSSSH